MNVLKTFVCATIGAITLCPMVAAAQGTQCHVSVEGAPSLIEAYVRSLRNHDPEHAAHLTQVVADIINGRNDALKSEIAAGLNPNTLISISEHGYFSLLTIAVIACHEDLVNLLLDGGASADGAEGDANPLVTAAETGQANVVRLLLEHGATVDKVDSDGYTALREAARQHHVDIVRALLAHGSNPNQYVRGKATVADLVSISSKDPDEQAIARELRAHGAISGKNRQ